MSGPETVFRSARGAVGEANACDYGVAVYTVLGRRAGPTEPETREAQRASSHDGREQAAPAFARKVAKGCGVVGDDDVEQLRHAGYTDGEVGEIVADVALNIFTNDFNHVAATELDFPEAPGRILDPASWCGTCSDRATGSVATIMDRNNETWLAHLGGTGLDQQAALSDLREALLRGLRRALAHRADADDAFLEDVVQDALVRILGRLPQFEGRSRFLTWAMSVAIRGAMSELRHRRWKDVSFDEVIADTDVTPGRVVDDGPGPDVQWEREAILVAMHEVIRNALTEKQRAVLLAELKGMPQDEIARHLGSNRNAVYKLTHDARKRLKRGLEAAGFTAEDIRTAFVG